MGIFSSSKDKLTNDLRTDSRKSGGGKSDGGKKGSNGFEWSSKWRGGHGGLVELERVEKGGKSGGKKR